MVDFADGSFMDKQPERTDCRWWKLKKIHKWEYETPGYRCCVNCGRWEIYFNKTRKWTWDYNLGAFPRWFRNIASKILFS
jgi:hypothetical protein